MYILYSINLEALTLDGALSRLLWLDTDGVRCRRGGNDLLWCCKYEWTGLGEISSGPRSCSAFTECAGTDDVGWIAWHSCKTWHSYTCGKYIDASKPIKCAVLTYIYICNIYDAFLWQTCTKCNFCCFCARFFFKEGNLRLLVRGTFEWDPHVMAKKPYEAPRWHSIEAKPPITWISPQGIARNNVQSISTRYVHLYVYLMYIWKMY